MFNDYAAEQFTKTQQEMWRQQAAADRLADFAADRRNTQGVMVLARQMRTLLVTGVLWLLHPLGSSMDVPFGHAG